MDGFLAKHLQGVSRTYAIVIPMLPRELAEAVGLAYLLMRVVDTVEDDPALADEARLTHFAELAALFADESAPTPAALVAIAGETDAERELMQALPEVMARLHGLPEAYRTAAFDCAREMMVGVRQFLARAAERGRPYPAVRDADEMREYCYYVAGVVGVMLNRMMAHYLRMPHLCELRDLSIELGVGLQLVNVLKDALKDAKHNRRYLPIAESGAVAPREIYRAALAEARTSLQRGVEFVLALPAHARELRYFCGLPIAWGAMTLAKAEQDAAQAKIGRSTIQRSIDRFKALAGDDRALRRWLISLVDPPTGRIEFA